MTLPGDPDTYDTKEEVTIRECVIVCDPEIFNAKPIVKGTRISVALILQCLASGMKRQYSWGLFDIDTRAFDAALNFAARQFQGEEDEAVLQ